MQIECGPKFKYNPLLDTPVESPFANYELEDSSPSPEKQDVRDANARGQRALENISPLFERLILEAESGASKQDEGEPVKRKLEMDEKPEVTILDSPQYVLTMSAGIPFSEVPPSHPYGP